MPTIRFLPESAVEVREITTFLEATRSGLGASFQSALARAFARLREHPEIGTPAEFGHSTRQWRLARFPYSIIYVPQGGVLVIVAVAHDRREPGYWRRRAR